MTAIMKGVRVVEVSEHAFLPAAGALLSDWGADVIKIEPVERGDAGRGIGTTGTADVNLLFENANRGKRSLALDLGSEEGREVLYRLVATADVFMTNKVARVREKLKIEVEHIRSHNPDIVYVRGVGQGERGPEANRGGYDLLTYWHRTGVSSMVAGPDGPPFLPAPGFGDFTGAMFIAGGTMGALYHRERTGEATVVDASLLATGMWAMSGAIAAATQDPAWPWPPEPPNPLSRTYDTREGGRIALCCLQAGYYWPLLTRHIGRDDLADDPRFCDYASIMANHAPAIAALSEEFLKRSRNEWCKVLADFPGQWTVVQQARDLVNDPQVAPNGYLQQCETAEGVPFQLVTAPLQYDGEPAPTSRAPLFNEHGDAILAELGLDWDSVVDLKIKGVVG
ncbi:MAG: CoA transferase [Novosphingobium sp.]|nr:CoA transferase [Novosphingobium sp.]